MRLAALLLWGAILPGLLLAGWVKLVGARDTATTVNSAPVLQLTEPLMISDIDEDNLQSPGNTVAEILASGGGNPITDTDPGALVGIAIIGSGASVGSWEYATTLPPEWKPVGVVSETAALLLGDESRLRFVPNPDYFGSTDEIVFRAWDRTSGKIGQRNVNTSVNGGSSAFSANTGEIGGRVLPVNDLPVLSGLPTEPGLYVEDDPQFYVLGDAITVTDIDNALLASAVVRLVAPPNGDAEQLVAMTEGTGITAVFEDAVLTLTGPAPATAFQQVLRSTRYQNASQDPNPAFRVVRVSVADSLGSSPISEVTFDVQPVNDPPELDLDGVGPDEDFETTFYINRRPVLIVDPSLVAADVDNTVLKSATIRISNLKNELAEVLLIDLGGSMNIKQAYDPATGILTLTGEDSVSSYQRVLRKVKYGNSLPVPDTEPRVIEFTLSDGVSTSDVRRSTVYFSEAPPAYAFFPMVTWTQRRGEEPNDTCAEAYPIGTGRLEAFLADDKDDWFFFDLPFEANVEVDLNNFVPRRGQIIVAGGQTCGNLTLLGSNGSSELNKEVNLGRRSPGRYFIWIINDGPFNTTDPYRLIVTVTP